MSPTERTARFLMALGATLFFFGLISGLLVPAMTNPRMGLAGHLEGVMNGTFLIAVGAAWSRLSLPGRLMPWASGLLLYGTYANWFFIGLAAIFGTSQATPLAGAGYVGLAWQENLVSLGLVSVALSMLVACGLLVWGFFRRQQGDETSVV